MRLLLGLSEVSSRNQRVAAIVLGTPDPGREIPHHAVGPGDVRLRPSDCWARSRRCSAHGTGVPRSCPTRGGSEPRRTPVAGCCWWHGEHRWPVKPRTWPSDSAITAMSISPFWTRRVSSRPTTGPNVRSVSLPSTARSRKGRGENPGVAGLSVSGRRWPPASSRSRSAFEFIHYSIVAYFNDQPFPSLLPLPP